MGKEHSSNLVVKNDIKPAELGRLLSNINNEYCDHSWKNFGLSDSYEELLNWENRLRPTWIFYYYSAPPEKPHLVAAATVAESINKEFPYLGFPVLGRCYIMPEFRGRGYYRKILEHRLQFCSDRYKTELKAIHMGTSDIRIKRAITSRTMAGWPTFTRIGAEALKVANSIHLVDAFLLFTPGYAKLLGKHLNVDNLPFAGCQLQGLLERILIKLTGNSIIGKKQAVISESSQSIDNIAYSGFSPDETFESNEYHAIEQLLRLCNAIPLTGFEKR